MIVFPFLFLFIAMCYGLVYFGVLFPVLFPPPTLPPWTNKDEADDMTRRWMGVVTSDSRFNPGIIRISKWLHLHPSVETIDGRGP